MKVTITGATGLVGSNLAIKLLEQGHEVRCTKRISSQTKHLSNFPIEWIDADITSKNELVKAFLGSNAVFHCAAEVSIKSKPTASLIKNNVYGMQCVIDAINEAKVPRLIHCSSIAAISVSETGEPVNESHSWNFEKYGLADGYAITKYESQQLVLKAAKDIDAVIVNPPYMFGPYDNKPSSGKLIIDVIKNRVPGFSKGVHNFVDVRDVCSGMIAAWQKGKRGEMYILSNRAFTYEEIIRLIAKIAGVKPPTFYIPQSIATIVGWLGDIKELITEKDVLLNSVSVRYAYCNNYIFSCEKAISQLGYQPSPIENAIRDAITWFKENDMC